MSISSTGGVTNFNPRSREGSDRSRCDGCPQRRHFNPRSREGSDAPGDKVRVTNQGFQSTLPRRERPCAAPPSVPFGTFQSTLPRRERRSTPADIISDVLFQSTLPRRERRSYLRRYQYLYLISIHAPAKGATFLSRACSSGSKNFNPRSREGSDVKGVCWHKRMGISIHAPAKGATYNTNIQCRTYRDFNPRSREGSDITSFHPIERHRDFNPRSREGSDPPALPPNPRAPNISIHAPAKGATGQGYQVHTQQLEFQSTLPRRERRRSRGAAPAAELDFNPRSREGSDGTVSYSITTIINFNPRSREGSDARCAAVRHGRSHFNPRSREGSDHPCAPSCI